MDKAEILGRLAKAVVACDNAAAVAAAQEALEKGLAPLEAVEEGLAKGVREVGDRFSRGELFLPELMMAAQAFQVAMGVLKPSLAVRGQEVKRLGRVVLGTVQGDIHDLGKNIVGLLASVSGFEVLDLGTDVAASTFVEKVRELKPKILGLSAMLTTTQIRQKQVLEALEAAGLRHQVKVMVGGAVSSEQWAQEIGADGHGADASDAVRKMRLWMGDVLQ